MDREAWWVAIWGDPKESDTTEHSIGIVKAMVFPVVMYNCESWTIKKAKH